VVKEVFYLLEIGNLFLIIFFFFIFFQCSFNFLTKKNLHILGENLRNLDSVKSFSIDLWYGKIENISLLNIFRVLNNLLILGIMQLVMLQCLNSSLELPRLLNSLLLILIFGNRIYSKNGLFKILLFQNISNTGATHLAINSLSSSLSKLP